MKLEDMIRQLRKAVEDRERRPTNRPLHRPLHEAQIATLREFYRAYRQNRFRPGDLVTPRPGVLADNCGEPHIVLEVRDDPEPQFGTEPGAASHGLRLDIRVLSLHPRHDVYVAYWQESWEFEPYVEQAGRR